MLKLFIRKGLGVEEEAEPGTVDSISILRAERILSWRHTGFNVHSLVRAKTKPEAERVGKYMFRPLLALEGKRLFHA